MSNVGCGAADGEGLEEPLSRQIRSIHQSGEGHFLRRAPIGGTAQLPPWQMRMFLQLMLLRVQQQHFATFAAVVEAAVLHTNYYRNWGFSNLERGLVLSRVVYRNLESGIRCSCKQGSRSWRKQEYLPQYPAQAEPLCVSIHFLRCPIL